MKKQVLKLFMLGALVISQNITEKQTKINTGNLSSGVYILHIQNKEAKQIVRLVID